MSQGPSATSMNFVGFEELKEMDNQIFIEPNQPQAMSVNNIAAAGYVPGQQTHLKQRKAIWSKSAIARDSRVTRIYMVCERKLLRMSFSENQKSHSTNTVRFASFRTLNAIHKRTDIFPSDFFLKCTLDKKVTDERSGANCRINCSKHEQCMCFLLLCDYGTFWWGHKAAVKTVSCRNIFDVALRFFNVCWMCAVSRYGLLWQQVVPCFSRIVLALCWRMARHRYFLNRFTRVYDWCPGIRSVGQYSNSCVNEHRFPFPQLKQKAKPNPDLSKTYIHTNNCLVPFLFVT